MNCKLHHRAKFYEFPFVLCIKSTNDKLCSHYVLNSLSGGELFERITADDYKISEAEVINYMRQICEGVRHMHEKNIIHLDIKVCIIQF